MNYDILPYIYCDLIHVVVAFLECFYTFLCVRVCVFVVTDYYNYYSLLMMPRVHNILLYYELLMMLISSPVTSFLSWLASITKCSQTSVFILQ